MAAAQPSNFDSRWGFSIQRRSPFAVHQGAPSQNIDSRLGFSIQRRPPVAIHQRELILPPLKILILAWVSPLNAAPLLQFIDECQVSRPPKF